MYVSKKTFTVLASLALLAIFGIAFYLFRSLYFSNLTAPTQQYDPITKFTRILPAKSASGKIASVAGSTPNPEKKLTIIFFYDGYNAQKDALLYIEVMKLALASVEPFKSMSDFIAFQIFTTDSKKCKVENDVLVCDKNLIDSFRKLGTNHFKVVIMSPDMFKSTAQQAHGENSWITISTNAGILSQPQFKRWLGILFTQNLGKSLGLFNEYDPSSVHLMPFASDALLKGIPVSGAPNCAPNLDSAKKWWGGYVGIFPEVGFYQGCGGSKDFYYPEENTLMSSDPQKEGYGAVSTDFLRGVLSCFYGEGRNISFPAGQEATYSATLKSCNIFMGMYPDFWTK